MVKYVELSEENDHIKEFEYKGITYINICSNKQKWGDKIVEETILSISYE